MDSRTLSANSSAQLYEPFPRERPSILNRVSDRGSSPYRVPKALTGVLPIGHIPFLALDVKQAPIIAQDQGPMRLISRVSALQNLITVARQECGIRRGWWRS